MTITFDGKMFVGVSCLVWAILQSGGQAVVELDAQHVNAFASSLEIVWPQHVCVIDTKCNRAQVQLLGV